MVRPPLTQSGAYEPVALIAWFDQAIKVGMPNATMAYVLGVTFDRISYFVNGEGMKMLRRRAAK